MFTLITSDGGKKNLLFCSAFHFTKSVCVPRFNKDETRTGLGSSFLALLALSDEEIYFSRLTSSPLPRSGRPSFLFLEWKQLDWVPSVDWPSRETRPCCARKLDRMNLLHPLSMYVLALLKTIKLKRLHFQCDTLSRACC